ncbi:MAG: glucokinase, partial [Myxococcota bacterium]
MRVLAGDIGGTNTRLALMRATDGELTIERRQTLASQSLDGLSAAATAFAEGAAIEGAAFAVAGPVHEGSAKLTNLRWSVNATELRSALGVPSEVLNDFASVALGVPHVADQLDPIRPREGSSKSQGVRLFVGAGTGFGVAYALGDAVHASEGGHIGLSPYDEASERAWRYAHERFGRV